MLAIFQCFTDNNIFLFYIDTYNMTFCSFFRTSMFLKNEY